MSTDNPLVTIYMPTHNRSELLSRAIDSVRAQTYSNFELIIVDDCSTDDTEAVVRSYQDKDTRIKYIKNSKNLGACASRNKAIRAAQGEFITGLDDDDYFLPNRISEFVSNWKSKPEQVILLYSKYLSKDSESLTYKKPIRENLGKFISDKDLLNSFYTGSQVFTRKQSAIDVGLYDERLLMWQDFDLYYRLLKLGLGMRVDVRSYVIDIHHGQTRISSSKIDKVELTYAYLIKKHKFSAKQKLLLQGRMFLYGDKFIRFKPSLYKFVVQPSRYTLKMLLKSLRKSLTHNTVK